MSYIPFLLSTFVAEEDTSANGSECEGMEAAPCDLHADADQQKCNDSEDAPNECRWDLLRDERRIPTEQINHGTQEHDAGEEPQEGRYLMGEA
jgi:hypothetical protein